MDVAMEMVMTVTPTAAETVGATIFELMERNEKANWRRTSVAPVNAGDWRSRMDRAAQQEARDLTQLRRTISKIANMLDAHTALPEGQWGGMKTSLDK